MTDSSLDIPLPGSATTARQSTAARAAIGASLGNLLEIYDFIAYGIFAVPISHAFFPTGDDWSALLLTFLTFGIGFLARPVGALVLGRYADRRGRRRALSLTIGLMATGTAIVAACPSYARIGAVAPLIVALGRLLQGFSAGGEIGGATATLVENAPPGRRALFASLQQMSQGGGILLAGLVGVAISLLPPAFDADGWRLAFVVGLSIAPVGLYIRLRLPETPEFVAHQAVSRTGAARTRPGLSAEHRLPLLLGVGVTALWTIATYVSNYFTTYAVRELHLAPRDSYAGQIAAGATLLLFSPLAGHLGDRGGRGGRTRWMGIGALGLATLAWPAFHLLVSSPSLPALLAVQAGFCVFLALYAGNASAVLADLFPTAVRATGVSLSYAVGVTLFGGFTPAVATWLLKATGDKTAVAGILIAAAAVSAGPLLWLRTRDRRDRSAR